MISTKDLAFLAWAPFALVVVPLILILILILFPPAADVRVCPNGFDLRTGVRPDGHYECLAHPVGDPEWDGTWRRSPDRSEQPSGIVEGRIWCQLGSRAVVVDYRTVGCARW